MRDFIPQFGHRNPDADIDKPDPFLAADMDLTRQIAVVIEQHYFGHPWMVKVNHAQGIVQIQIPHLMPATCWYVVHIRDLHSDPGMKAVIRGCGDILERYKLPRAAYDREEFIAAMKAIPMVQRASGHGNVPT